MTTKRIEFLPGEWRERISFLPVTLNLDHEDELLDKIVAIIVEKRGFNLYEKPASKLLRRRLRQVFLWPMKPYSVLVFSILLVFANDFCQYRNGSLTWHFCPINSWHSRARRNLTFAMPT